MKWEELRKEICQTLEAPPLSASITIKACETLSQRILKGSYDKMLQSAGILSSIDKEELLAAARAISADTLKKRLERELGGENWIASRDVNRLPLGVLLHIGAGNVKGLGAYSVLEGLLTGNINILKPSGEDSFSALFLKELVRLEPALKPYVYVFSIPSSNRQALCRLAQLADGIAVWGGDEAIQAVRAFAGPDKRLIEWGHRFSFTYITKEGLKNQEALKDLAWHLMETQQRLCSSCQGIFLEEGSPKELALLLKEQVSILSAEKGESSPSGRRAQNTIRCYTLELQDALHGKNVFRAEGCPIYPLPRADIIPYLRSFSFALQTVGLICKAEEIQELSYLLLRSGAVKICPPHEMSAFPGGTSHDGEFPLLRYTKVIEC